MKLALALALASLNPIFSSQQQQEALPDETEVVEETVAEVSEVGGWGTLPLPAPRAFPEEPRRALWVSCWIRTFVPAVHTAQMETLYIL